MKEVVLDNLSTRMFFRCNLCENWYRREFKMRDYYECVNCHNVAEEVIEAIEATDEFNKEGIE